MHFFIISCLTIHGFIDSYSRYKGNYTADKSGFDKGLTSILFFKPINYYRSFAGLESSYGFFSPNVSSEIMTVYYVKFQGADDIKIFYSPFFRSKESLLKYSTAIQIYLDLLDENNHYSNSSRRLLKLFSKSLIMDFNSSCLHRKIEYTTLKVYLYNFPKLCDYNRNSRTEALYLLDSQSMN